MNQPETTTTTTTTTMAATETAPSVPSAVNASDVSVDAAILPLAGLTDEQQLILLELATAFQANNPPDPLQFAAYHFQERLATDRAQLLNSLRIVQQQHPEVAAAIVSSSVLFPIGGAGMTLDGADLFGVTAGGVAGASAATVGGIDPAGEAFDNDPAPLLRRVPPSQPTAAIARRFTSATTTDGGFEDDDILDSDNEADNLMQDITGADGNALPGWNRAAAEASAEADAAFAVAANRGRRTSISAESMAPNSADEPFTYTIVPKTDEQIDRIEAAISGNFLFRDLPEEQRRVVIGTMVEKQFPSGTDVIRQGDEGDFFYVVESGTLDCLISREGDGGQPTKVTDYSAGGTFGELALMYGAPRAATVRATSNVVLWALDRVPFRKMLMNATHRQRRTYESFLAEIPLLLSLEPYERHKIADALDSRVFEDGEVVMRQGDTGDEFYLIESGEARVSKIDEHGIERIYPNLTRGKYFGELALLTNKPRQASIVAVGRLKCAVLNKRQFNRLLGPAKDIIKRDAANYAAMKALVK